MYKSLWTWILIGAAVVLIGGYGLLKFMGREPATPMPWASVVKPKGGNPLLTADKAAVARWFPGHCFAELYNRDPSFGGQLIPSCIVDVIRQVKGDTGVTLTQEDVQSSEVLAHFKEVFGDDDLWRQ